MALIAPKLSFAEMTLREAIEIAAINNPAVQAAWNALEASGEGVRAAKGGYLPSVDLDAEVGSERSEDPFGQSTSLDTSSYRLTITQMLFDGFSTKQQVAKQNFTKNARYYEFRLVAEEVALQTAQAYLDVLRYRDLVSLANENYQQHMRYHKDIQDRVTSGLGRGVDLSQAQARLALAQSNMLTENANLHDVSARFYRLVGQFPPEDMGFPEISVEKIPPERYDALIQAFAENPELNAAIEYIRVARADLEGRRAPMMPRLDLRLRKQLDDNVNSSLPGEYDEEAVELVLSYNLYRGGSDTARKKQAKFLKWEAEDNRDRVCREVRQTVSIAHNNISVKEQLVGFLEKNLEAISKAREAYKKQFDIGQRTLLDLLDTENEYFEVERTLVNAESEVKLAQLQTLAGMGALLHSLDVESYDRDIVSDMHKDREEREVELSARCPAEGPAMKVIDFKPKVESQSRGLVVTENDLMRLDVKFKPQSATLTHDVGSEISRAAAFMCSNTGVIAVVEGHTDSLGSAAYNLQLSQARAESVRDALIMECDSARGRLNAKGYGESRPVATNETELGRATNRRVELRIKSRNLKASEPLSLNGSSVPEVDLLVPDSLDIDGK
ncbi:Outer membrane efflux protein BepC [Thalassocella blandensis]|nr:Outer membrane efflux protein BepC [Thalassocella blandensis]